jgi:hypothetical protein
MANAVEITGVSAGIRIPVVVENRPNEAVPVSMAPSPLVEFLRVGQNYRITVGAELVAVELRSKVAFPWVIVHNVGNVDTLRWVNLATTHAIYPESAWTHQTITELSAAE